MQNTETLQIRAQRVGLVLGLTAAATLISTAAVLTWNEIAVLCDLTQVPVLRGIGWGCLAWSSVWAWRHLRAASGANAGVSPRAMAALAAPVAAIGLTALVWPL